MTRANTIRSLAVSIRKMLVLVFLYFASSLFAGVIGAVEIGGKTKITFRYRSLLNGFLGFGGVDCDVRYSNIDRQYFCATREKRSIFFFGTRAICASEDDARCKTTVNVGAA